jgi:hypothetical protein
MENSRPPNHGQGSLIEVMKFPSSFAIHTSVSVGMNPSVPFESEFFKAYFFLAAEAHHPCSTIIPQVVHYCAMIPLEAMSGRSVTLEISRYITTRPSSLMNIIIRYLGSRGNLGIFTTIVCNSGRATMTHRVWNQTCPSVVSAFSTMALVLHDIELEDSVC